MTNQNIAGTSFDIPQEEGKSASEVFQEAAEKVKSAGNWLKEKLQLEKFATVAGAWKDDVLNTIKLNTVDKWSMLSERRGNNKLIERRRVDIKASEISEASLKEERATISQNSERELALYDQKMAAYTDPGLIEILKTGKENKRQAYENQATQVEEKIVMEGRGQEIAQRSIEMFQGRIGEAEQRFVTKINSKIDSIHQKSGYAEKIEQRTLIQSSLNNVSKGITEAESTLMQFEDAMNTFTDKELAQRFKEKMREAKDKIAGLKKTESKLLGAKTKLDNKIARIDGKVQKYEDLKVKYGLVSAETTENTQPPIEDVVTEEMVAVGSENVTTSQAESIDTNRIEEGVVPESVTGELDNAPDYTLSSEELAKLTQIEFSLNYYLKNGSISETTNRTVYIDPHIEKLKAIGADTKKGPLHEVYKGLMTIREKQLFATKVTEQTRLIYEGILKNIAKVKGNK